MSDDTLKEELEEMIKKRLKIIDNSKICPYCMCICPLCSLHEWSTSEEEESTEECDSLYVYDSESSDEDFDIFEIEI